MERPRIAEGQHDEIDPGPSYSNRGPPSDFSRSGAGRVLLQDQPGRAYAETWLPDSLSDDFDIDDKTEISTSMIVPIGVQYFVVTGDESWVQRIRQSFPILTRR